MDMDDVARLLALQRKQTEAMERICGYLLRLSEGIEALVALGEAQMKAWEYEINQESEDPDE